MKDNKLIAEFMGNNTIRVNVPFEYELDKELPTSGNICKTNEDAMEEVQTEIDEGIISGCDLYMEESSYHTSWDWLMPVIHRIRDHVNVDMGFEEFDDWRENFKQIDPYNYNLEQCYDAVVEFIKEYNDRQG